MAPEKGPGTDFLQSPATGMGLETVSWRDRWALWRTTGVLADRVLAPGRVRTSMPFSACLVRTFVFRFAKPRKWALA